jgi:Ca2+-binding EF-hand superfamily protein
LSKEKLWGLFNYFDTAKNGFITKHDLKEIFLRNGITKTDQ